MEVLGFSGGQFWAAMLLLARVGSLFVFMPPLSHRFVPRRIKAGATLVLTASLAYMGVSGTVIPPEGMVPMTALVVREIAIGMMLGLVIQTMFLAVLFGGQVAGIQMGMNAANLMDPLFQANVAEVSYFYYYTALLIFLSIGGDRIVIETMVGNLHAMPLGHANISGTAVKALVTWTGEIFSTGFILGAPVLASLFATTVLLGILARSVPQINMLMLGYSLKIFVGFTIVGITMPSWIEAFTRFLHRSLETFQAMARLMGG